MFPVDQFILLASILLLVGIASSKFSMRLGLPFLVLFLLVGMLAGEDGPGGIAFDNHQVAHAVGTLALAAILFDGGLQTSFAAVRSVWKPAALLATLGVFLTALVTGIAASYFLDISLLEGLLLGSIIGSTDAAAVFGLLRNAGIHLRYRLKSVLEIESASNDPMAIFLTIGVLEVLMGQAEPGPALLRLFVLQMGVGAAVGLGVGWLATRVINRIDLASAGLYPVLASSFALFSFGAAALMGGSGFLAVFLTGVLMGNRRIVFQKGTYLFHDALAWIGQILMFVMLGMLVTPSELLPIAGVALLISAVLILVARPIAVIPLLLPFGFNVREVALISWTGLKGSVPIILAMYPLLFGLPSGALLFNIVFFVVLVSAIVQGGTLSWIARKLNLEEEGYPEPPVTLEITSLRDVDADIVEYTVGADSRATDRRLSQLALPNGVVVAMIARDNALIPPRGSTTILAGDHVFAVLRSDLRPLVDRVFTRNPAGEEDLPPLIEFQLRGEATVEDLADFYGIGLDAPGSMSLDELIRERFGEGVFQDRVVSIDGVKLHIIEMVAGKIVTVGFAISSSEEDEELVIGAHDPLLKGAPPIDRPADLV